MVDIKHYFENNWVTQIQLHQIHFIFILRIHYVRFYIFITFYTLGLSNVVFTHRIIKHTEITRPESCILEKTIIYMIIS